METLIASTGVTLAVITFAIALAAIKHRKCRPEPVVEPAVVVPERVVLAEPIPDWDGPVDCCDPTDGEILFRLDNMAEAVEQGFDPGRIRQAINSEGATYRRSLWNTVPPPSK